MIEQVEAHAKLNLFLYVTGKRADGYHELSMLMARIALCDRMAFTFGKREITVSCSHPLVPEDASNLAFKAADLFYRRFETLDPNTISKKPFASENRPKQLLEKNRKVHIHIDKQIPVGGGLGGGSSNAAAVLTTLNRCFDFPFSDKKLMEMALIVGADVPFFIKGETAVVQGIGERLRPCPSLLLPKSVLLFHPGFSVSTMEVFKNVDLGLTKSAKFNINSLLKTVDDGSVWTDMMHNDLEMVACQCYPELKAFRDQLCDLLPEKVMMTGSGSTFYSIFSDRRRAEIIFSELSEKWKESDRRVWMTSFIER